MATYHEVMDGNARSSHKGGKSGRLTLHVREVEGGGHSVEHFSSNALHDVEPPMHVFAAHEGAKLIDHLKQHLNIGTTGEKEQKELAGGGEEAPEGDPNPGEAVAAKK